MARPVQGGAILEVANVGRYDGQRIMNVWHYRWTGAPTPTEDGDLIVEALKAVIQNGPVTGLMAALRTMSNEGVDWEGIRYQWITPIRYSPVFSDVGSGPGANAEAPLPPNVAGVVTLQTIFAGPGFTGRKHFSGLSQDDVNSGSTSVSWRNNAFVTTSLMLATIDTAAIQPASQLVPVVFKRTAPNLSPPWVNFTMQTTSRVMRRRTVGVGE